MLQPPFPGFERGPGLNAEPPPPDVRWPLLARLGLCATTLYLGCLALLGFTGMVSGRELVAVGGVTLLGFAGMVWAVAVLVGGPLRRVNAAARALATGAEPRFPVLPRADELGALAATICEIGREVRRREIELTRQRDLYQNLFEHVPCAITIQDRSLKLLRFNHIYAERFPEARIGQHCYEIYKGSDKPCAGCTVLKTFADGRPHIAEEIVYGKDGSPDYYLISTSPMIDADGHIHSVMEISLDITGHKLLEQELAKSRKKYHAIFSNIPFSIFVLDRDTLAIKEVNSRPSAVYGYSENEFLGMCFLDLFSDGGADRAVYERLIREERVLDRVRHHKKSGRDFYVNLRVSSSEYPGAKVFLVTSSDITKRLETEQQLIQASKMATLGEMATGVAHELNQPLTVIKAASDLLLRRIRMGQALDAELLRELADSVAAHIDRASKIINHMREFGRKSDLKLAPVDLGETVRRTFEFFAQQFKVRNIGVRWDVAEGLPPVMAEANRLEQVFMNLLVNARDAVEERWNGVSQSESDRWVDVTVRSDQGGVSVRVADSGVGIPPELMEKVFEPFFTTKDVGKGTGLGLAISYGIVQDYGGTIRAESGGPGGGAAFIIRLPAAAREIPAMAAGQAPQEHDA